MLSVKFALHTVKLRAHLNVSERWDLVREISRVEITLKSAN